MKKFFGILSLLLICLLTSCTFVVTNPINSIEIMKNDVAIDELKLVVGEESSVGAVLNDGYNASIVWTSSNPEIVSVDKYGNLTVNKKG